MNVEPTICLPDIAPVLPCPTQVLVLWFHMNLVLGRTFPPYVCIPKVPNEFAGSGYLSSSYGPFGLGGDPAKGDFKVKDLTLPNGITEDRFNKRRSLLNTVDDHFRQMEKSDALSSMDNFYNDAYSLISSKEAREAFDMKKESDKTKERYGKNEAGQRMLLSRRLGGVGCALCIHDLRRMGHAFQYRTGISKTGA